MKFSMSEAWRDATAMLSANREVMVIVAGIFFFIPSLAVNWSLGDLQEIVLADPGNAQQAMLSLYTRFWWLFVLTTIVSMIGNLTLLALLRDHNRPTVGEAIVTGLVGFLPWLGASIILGIGLGILILVVGIMMGATGNVGVAFFGLLIVAAVFCYVMVKVSLSGPVVAIDKVYNPITIITRSWKLTKGNSFRLFLFYLLLFIVYIVIAGIASVIVNIVLALAAGPETAQLVNALVSAIISAIFYLAYVAVLAAAHRQLSGPSEGALSTTFE